MDEPSVPAGNVIRLASVTDRATLQPDRFQISSLGPATVPSPLGLSSTRGDYTPDYVEDGVRIRDRIELAPGTEADGADFEKAGPRARLYFDPKKTNVGVVTCGGLCPGINNVIRSIVLELTHKYGVRSVTGFRYGFAGLDPSSGVPEPIPLGPDEVRHIHVRGGTMLGTSRGGHDPEVTVETLLARDISILFAIGGDGTMRGAHAIAKAASARGAKLAVIGIPKTIDNDIPFVDKTFGFETAVSMARVAIDAAHTEALSAQNGIGLVRLMGREAGFIAANATIASHDVNICLVPEVPFRLDGPNGLLAHLERRLRARGHAVIVVAEGCGRVLVDEASAPRDASGNIRFAELDIGRYLSDRIDAYLSERMTPHTIKYIDPSYMLRGVPANAMDAVFCAELARNAVHAAMAGKTDMMVGRLHRAFTHVPLTLVNTAKKRIDPDGQLWLAVTESTGQPRFF